MPAVVTNARRSNNARRSHCPPKIHCAVFTARQSPFRHLHSSANYHFPNGVCVCVSVWSLCERCTSLTKLPFRTSSTTLGSKSTNIFASSSFLFSNTPLLHFHHAHTHIPTNIGGVNSMLCVVLLPNSFFCARQHLQLPGRRLFRWYCMPKWQVK